MRQGLLFLLLALSALYAGETMSPAAYRARLDELAEALATSDRAHAESIAEHIATAQVAWPAATLPGDPTLRTLVHDGALAEAGARVAALRAEIARLTAGAASGPAAEKADTTALAAIAERQARAAALLRRGGEIGGMPLDPANLPASFNERMLRAIVWFGQLVRDCWDWFMRWFGPRDEAHGHGGSGVSGVTFLVVGVLVILAVSLALLAWRRRGAVSPPAAGDAPLPTQADADPRSRAADEWVRFAHELTAQGRYREAVRAWYHALLVECWSFGLLHHRVGRTNWEYALALSGDLPWRSGFHGLTRSFDLAWYGGRDDAESARAFADEAQALLARLRVPGSPV
jgi:hypothetical protein